MYCRQLIHRGSPSPIPAETSEMKSSVIAGIKSARRSLSCTAKAVGSPGTKPAVYHECDKYKGRSADAHTFGSHDWVLIKAKVGANGPEKVICCATEFFVLGVYAK
jgi:hypothetical protein